MKFQHLHHADQQTIDRMYQQSAPVFIISTGRSGTQFLARILNHSPELAAFHEPRPTLQYFANFAYGHQAGIDTLMKMFDAARMESILETYIEDKIYVEANQCLTFFAPAIARLYPAAKFAELVRHPGDFARSAIRKGWFRNDSIWESGRVRMAGEAAWNTLSQIEKLAWLWATSHGFIQQFFQQLAPERFCTCRLEDLISDPCQVNKLIRFIGAAEIPHATISRLQTSPVNTLQIGPVEPPNMKKVRDFPLYRDWDERMKGELARQVKSLGSRYGYTL